MDTIGARFTAPDKKSQSNVISITFLESETVRGLRTESGHRDRSDGRAKIFVRRNRLIALNSKALMTVPSVRHQLRNADFQNLRTPSISATRRQRCPITQCECEMNHNLCKGPVTRVRSLPATSCCRELRRVSILRYAILS